MTVYIALLRAVNVGGTGKLPMTELKAMCESAGFTAVRTYIASGNVLFQSRLTEAAVQAALEASLHRYAGRPVGVVIRTAAELAQVVAGNPFPDAPGNRVLALFLNGAATPRLLEGVANQHPDEHLALGRREIYIHYGNGVAASRLRIPAARDGTARNMNTVAKLAELATGASA